MYGSLLWLLVSKITIAYDLYNDSHAEVTLVWRLASPKSPFWTLPSAATTGSD